MIVVFLGYKRTGKSTTAQAFARELEARSVTTKIRSFAGPVKDTCTSMGWDGEKDEKGRALLVAVGMAGRNYDSNLWADLFKPGEEQVTLNDDLRFNNEYRQLKKNYPGQVIFVRLYRKGVGLDRDDSAEAEIDSIPSDITWHLEEDNTAALFDKILTYDGV